jgi:anti-anti-sigma factor
MDTNYRYNEQNGIGVFEFLHEKLNFENAGETINNIKNIITKKNISNYIFNLYNVATIDSVGIGYLIAMKNAAVKKKSNILLVSDSELVLKVLRITRMDSFFKIFRSLDDAIAAASEMKK